jgi:uncharacterized protein YigA (DUF484 family)
MSGRNDDDRTLRETIAALMEGHGRNEQSFDRLARLASRALQDPGSLTHDEIRSLAGSVLTQAPNRT